MVASISSQNLNSSPLYERFKNDINYVTKLPFSASELAKVTGNFNMHRISTRFSMITLKESLLLAKQNHWLDGFEKSINIGILDAPIGVYNALSVALSATRFLFTIILIFYNTLNLSNDGRNLSIKDRFIEQIKEHHYSLINDAVWSIINGLTNYAPYFHIAAPVAGALMLGFLVFDVAWLFYAVYLQQLDYAAKKNIYDDIKKSGVGEDKLLQLNEDIKQLEYSNVKNNSMLYFCIAAASILVLSFSVAILLSPPFLVPVCFLICNIAIAMYLSREMYGTYEAKRFITSQSTDENALESLKTDENKAWNDLVATMLKNTLMPFIILGAFTVNVPAAIVLTLGYMAYQCGQDYIPDLLSLNLNRKT